MEQLVHKDELTVALFQIDLRWNAPSVNLQNIEKYIADNSFVDMVVLPEAFTTGFSVNDIKAETMDGDTVKWLLALAKQHKVAIVGSLFISEKEKYYNRLLLVSPQGEIQHYDKWHLFNFGKENQSITEGKKAVLFDYLGWKIKPIICYDLRFPVFIRNKENYDLILCVANWPQTRIDAWDTLLKARAIENVSYVVGVNRVGNSPDGLIYNGHSNVFSPTGKALLDTNENEKISTVTIAKKTIIATRKIFPFLADGDDFTML